MEVPRVLVTGASGFIATHIVKKLLEQGFQVRGTVRSKANEKRIAPLKNLYPGAKHELELVEIDLQDPLDKWVDVVRGCTYVLHTASPVVLGYPSEDQIVKPALTGTLNVLRACKISGDVKRVVQTSSIVAVHGDFRGGRFDKNDWTDLSKSHLQPYVRSKTVAEKAARDYVNELGINGFEFVTINPAVVVGPALCGSLSSTLELAKVLLEPPFAKVPKSNFPMVHVHDVADMHVLAMTDPNAPGQRYIAASGNLWFIEMADILRKEFGPMGYKVPRKVMPNSLLWFASLFSDEAKTAYANVSNTATTFDNGPMLELLGRQPTDYREGIIEMAYSLVEAGFVKKTSGYRARRNDEEVVNYSL